MNITPYASHIFENITFPTDYCLSGSYKEIQRLQSTQIAIDLRLTVQIFMKFEQLPFGGCY